MRVGIVERRTLENYYLRSTGETKANDFREGAPPTRIGDGTWSPTCRQVFGDGSNVAFFADGAME